MEKKKHVPIVEKISKRKEVPKTTAMPKSDIVDDLNVVGLPDM